MAPVYCFPREKFEEVLTSLGLSKTKETHKCERKWKTRNGKTLWVSDISESEALTTSYVAKVLEEIKRLDESVNPPGVYPWGL